MASATSSSGTPYTENWIPGPSGINFYTRTYIPPPSELSSPPHGVLVIVHGFADQVGRSEYVHAAFARKGFVVFSYDQRGFGRTALDKEHKSKESKYGKTSWPEQFGDIEWAIEQGRKAAGGGNLPVFIVGHSMGGGLVLGFPTRTTAPPSKTVVNLLAGVISNSPLLHLTHPTPSFLRWVGAKLALAFPTLSFPAGVDVNKLSHDPAVAEANANDPLIKRHGTLRGLNDMLNGGEEIVEEGYKHWPPTLPLLLVHGTADEITSPKITQALFDKVGADDKEIFTYEGGYHELHNEPEFRDRWVDDCSKWMEKRAELWRQGSKQWPPETSSKL